MPTDPPPPKRKRRSSNGNSTSTSTSSTNGGATKSPSNKELLIRLSEGCISHQRNHHHDHHDHDDDLLVDENDKKGGSGSNNGSGSGDGSTSTQTQTRTRTRTSNNNDNNTLSEQCIEAMESLKSIVPIIESALLDANTNINVNVNTTVNTGIQDREWERECGKNQGDPNDIVNLCMFYKSVVECTYCPHSMEILFDNGRGGIEILPRVHQLFCHLASESMVQDAWKILSKDKGGGRKAITTTTTTTATTSGAGIVAADQISHTIAILLNAIPESNIYMDVVQDIINTTQDLNELVELGVLDDPDVKGHQIDIVVFAATQAAQAMTCYKNNGVEEEKEISDRKKSSIAEDRTVPIGSVERLLMLQSSLFQVLFHLFVMQYCRQSGENLNGGDAISIERDEKNATLFPTDSGPFLLDEHESDMLLTSIRRVMGMNMDVDMHLKNLSSLVIWKGPKTKTRMALLIRNKIMACNVLLLMVPTIAKQCCIKVWIELMDMVTEVVLRQVEFVAQIDNWTQVDKALKHMIDSLLATLVTLISEVHVSILAQRILQENDMWTMRLQNIFTFFDCLPFISKLAKECSPVMERLSMMILQIVYISLFPESMNQKLNHRTILLLLEYCTLNSIYPILFDLCYNRTFHTLVTSIIQRLWFYIGLSGKDQYVLGRAFKYTTQNPSVGEKSSEGSNRYNLQWGNDTAFDSSLGLFLSGASNLCQRILTRTLGNDDGDDAQNSVLISLLEGDDIHELFYAMHLVESILSQKKKTIIPSSSENILIQFYNAGISVSKVFSTWLENRNEYIPSTKEKQRISFLIEAMSKMFLSGIEKDVWPQNIQSNRRCMMKSIADVTIIGWAWTSEDATHPHRIHLPLFTRSCLTLISKKQEQMLHLSFGHIDTDCKGISYNVAKAFGVVDSSPRSYQEHDYMYHLVTNLRKPITPKLKKFVSNVSTILLENFLPPQKFSILMTNIYLCYPCDKGKTYNAYLNSIHTKINDEARLACLNSLPSSLLASCTANRLKMGLDQTNLSGILHQYLLRRLEEPNGHDTWALKIESLSRIIVMMMNPSEYIEERLPTDDRLGLSWSYRILTSFHHDPLISLENVDSDPCFTVDPSFFELLLKVVEKVVRSAAKVMFSAAFRYTLWKFLALVSMCTPPKDLERLSGIRIPICGDIDDNIHQISGTLEGTDTSSNSRKSKSNKTINIFEWLLQVIFTDENENLRLYAANQLGMIFFHDKFKILKALVGFSYQLDDRSYTLSRCEEMYALFFDLIDSNLHKYCGITQSELSCTMKTTCTTATGTYTSGSSGDLRSTSDNCSRQISALMLISSLCQQRIEPSMRSILVEKAVMRLVRFWVAASFVNTDDLHFTRHTNFQDITRIAFTELQTLHHLDLFNEDSIAHFHTSFVPGLLSEILSRSLQVHSIDMQGPGMRSIYEMLVEFISSLLIDNSPRQRNQEDNNDIADRFLQVLGCFDSFLPSIIAGFVIEKDYESLCACTGFRLFLLSELKRIEKKGDEIQSTEYVLGSNNQKKRYLYGSKKFNTKDLKSQTAQLCVSVEARLNVLGHVLKSLLLQREKSSMVFFLKTVIQAKVHFGMMLKKTEFTVLEGLVSDLGAREDEVHDYISCDASPQKLYEHCDAFRAMKHGALWLRRVHEKTDAMDENSSSVQFSLDSLNMTSSESLDSEIIVFEWINKHFMQLLVNVTTKWKRGRIDMKILAMKSLQVLVSFLRLDNSTQYVTQVLGIVDGCMNLHETFVDNKKRLGKLRSLATKVLSRFVRMLLYKVDVVGEHLCNIIVSLNPLFGEVGARPDPYESDAVLDAIDLLETLVDGETGIKLAQYFLDVPFLPNDDRLEKVRDALKRNGVNLDSLLLVSTQMTNTQASNRERESISTASSINTQEDGPAIARRTKLRNALRKRLSSFQKFLGHENENVRIACLRHIIKVVEENRELFESLIEDEDSSLRFLTVQFTPERSSGYSSDINSFLKAILRRCTLETNPDVRLLLAECLGKVGAISPMYIDNDQDLETDLLSDDGKRWLVENGKPWKTKMDRVHYEKQLVTHHFVIALKAARTPTDQHKIAFAIQEVLQSLNSNGLPPNAENGSFEDNRGKKQMTPWLNDLLKKAEVLSVIEPFWSTRYKQTETCKLRSPPFFPGAKSYYLWLAEWGRFMIERSHNNERSLFREVFYACRSAIRSEAGLGILEFLLPVLVLDSLSFGEQLDRSTTVNEMKNVLENLKESKMGKLEKTKSVECVFSTLKTLQFWAENEVEDRHKAQRGSGSRKRAERTRNDSYDASVWSAEDAVGVIEDLQNFVPFSLRAEAAAHVGMHAQALRFLEIDVRRREAKYWFDNLDQTDAKYSYNMSVQNSGYVGQNHIEKMEVGLYHRLLGELRDRNAMSAMARCRDQLSIMDQIREKQSHADWNGVLRLCELASQIKHEEVDTSSCELEVAQIKALLELGQLDNALNQVTGLIGDHKSDSGNHATLGANRKNALLPFAVQASWRLGRWDVLNEFLNAPEKRGRDKSGIVLDHDGNYNLALGKAILGLHRKNKVATLDALREARESIIPPLSVVASEDYSRAYPYLMKLQCCREIEDAVSDLSLVDKYLHDAKGSLLGHTIPMETFVTRLALARILSCPEQEAHLWLSAGRKARKEGLFHIAENSLCHADTIYQRLKRSSTVDNQNDFNIPINLHASEVRLQLAKLRHASGGLTEALHMIELNKFNELLQNQNNETVEGVLTSMRDKNESRSFARSALQATEWMVESGLKSGSDAIARYNMLNQISPDWERAHFQFAKYLETILDSRIMAYAAQKGMTYADNNRPKIIATDSMSQKYLMEVIKEYGEALKFSQKHVFQALPRLLTLWTDFTGIDSSELNEATLKNQDDTNELIVPFIKNIPTVCFYSVLPQLISRIGHSDVDTSRVLCAILKKVLVKYPAHALWHLAWLRHSIHDDRKKRGEELFKGAQKHLQRTEQLGMHDLLGASKDLFEILINLARFQPKQVEKTLHVQPWSFDVDLTEFIPPVQAALTLSKNAVGSKDRKEAFPTQIPRIRAFKTAIQFMASKARPKKLTAFVVPEGSQHIQNTNERLSTDIGEMHFLVKQEAKGDLRKDARVQDLNTVINRLFTNSAGSGKESKCFRRLTLRTYSVICLSEDCGILEWVPNTNSLRNLITASFNPYASHHSNRRRGKRGTNFGDNHLRQCFTQCQNQYIKMGNLTKAGKMFDEKILRDYPPVFYWWFVQNFQDPHQWFEARTRFALSAAAWSAVGHVIGLGDRHTENILIDTTSGDCVHVDFDCIFDKGLLLPRPEVVPFRLTSNILDAFGPNGADGTFSGGLQSAMTTLRDNRDVLLSVLEPFIRDPVIEWKRQRTQQKAGKKDKPTSSDGKRSIRTIDERLRGIYNLRNPNHKKITRVDQKSDKEDDEMAHMLPLSIEGQVHKMIKEATSHENLVQLYVGWMPWL